MRVKIKIGKVKKEMFWVCKMCGCINPGLSGPEAESMRCTSCGNRKSDEPYIRPEDVQTAPEITDTTLLERAGDDKNWICPSCRYEERDGKDQCNECGAPRPVVPPQVENPPAKPPRTPAPYTLPKPPRRWVPILISILLGAFGLFAVGGIVYVLSILFAVHETTATVTNISWRRTEVLHQRETRDDGKAWEDDLPDGAFNKRCKEKQHGTEDCNEHECKPGEEGYKEDDTVPCNCTEPIVTLTNCTESIDEDSCEDKGNGAMECDKIKECDRNVTPGKCDKCPNPDPDPCYDQCPVMDQWCSYSYYEWVVAERKQTSGTDLNPHWPGLKAGNLQRLERTEWYLVKFRSGIGEREHLPKSEAEFQRFPIGATYRAKYNRAGMFDPYERID